MIHKQKNTGFTLIELLVVIAIIAVLAATVLVVVMSNIARFNDGRIISAMNQIRTKASILYQNNQNYLDIECSDTTAPDCNCTDTEVEILCNDILENSDQNLILRLNSDSSGFCAVAHLEGDGQYFCIDGNLKAKQYAVSPATSVCAVACVGAKTCRCE